jgi:predicted ATPase
VLVSLGTEELLRDSLVGGVELLDLGEHRLRDLSRPERIFQLRAPGLTTDFPSLRSLDAFPGNLPQQLTSFVGRDRELVEVAKAFNDSRLVTLTGTGGVGKTRLAIHIAAELLPDYADGAWLCELASASDPETMVDVIAATLGVTVREGMSLDESIRDYLGSQCVLLVLDNCEHLLLAASRFVEAVLHRCPNVRILATSREGLGAEGEQVWSLRSLAIGDPDVVLEVEQSDAVRLFIERAHAARSGFRPDAAAVPVVAEICRRLDGIPLAIELAAARVVALSPSDIADLLDERFRLLTGGRRTAVERHQTLRATVDWSYSLLEPAEQLVFDRLGVFAGSFDATGATAVAAGTGIEAFDVVDALTGLVAKSMVVAEETAEGHGRFQLLETMRQYARERLDYSGDADARRRRLAEYCAQFAERARGGLRGRDELVWRPRVNAELDNLRAATFWSLDRERDEDLELAFRIIAALGSEELENPTSGIGVWAERAVARLGRTTPELQYAVTATAALHLANHGEYTRARELALLAIEDGVPRDALFPSSAYAVIAFATSTLGDGPGGLEHAREATLVIDVMAPQSVDSAYLHANAAFQALWLGDPIARREAELAVRIARDVGNPSTVAWTLLAYGWALTDEDPDVAIAALEESAALSRSGASQLTWGPVLFRLSMARVHQGDYAAAAADIRESLDHCLKTGTRATLFTGVWCGVEILEHFGLLADAARFAGIATAGTSEGYLTGGGWTRQHVASERARAGLGATSFDEAFAEGAAMTYDEAAAYVIRVFDDVVGDA